MMMYWSIYILMVLLLYLPFGSMYRYDCSRIQYEKCTKIADPLIKEPHLVFPDNMDDIDLVCRTWNKFVDCLKYYTDNCFTIEQRKQFNKAVENPIESVHQMCMQPAFQKEYLKYAPCIRSIIVERQHCGSHYNLLVDQVSQGEVISKSVLCCSHDRFKQCLEKETRNLCDNNLYNGPAYQFSNQIIDKSLSFLQDQCYNYIPNSGDCTSISSDYITDPMIMTSPIAPQRDNTYQDSIQGKEIIPSSSSSSRAYFSPKTTKSWLPSSTLQIDRNPSSSPLDYSSSGPSQPPQSDATIVNQENFFNSQRARPSSYGRANTWMDVTSSTPTNVGLIHPITSVNNWMSQSTNNEHTSQWFNPTSIPSSSPSPPPSFSSETWYPAAGNQLSNELDEPNQQGLMKSSENNGIKISGEQFLLIILIIFALF